MSKIIEILNKIGLTKQESTVYLALLELQESQTGKLCRITKIASSNIYAILDSLIQKGLASYRMQNNIKVFMPSPPESLNELFIEKQQKLNEEKEEVLDMIAQLKKREIKEKPQSNYKYFEGMTGIKSLWNELTSSLTRTSKVYIYGAKKEAYERLVGFYDEHHKVRTKLQAMTKIIMPFTDKKLGKRRRTKSTQVRYDELENQAEWGVVDDVVYIQHIVTKQPHGFMIKDKIFADTFVKVFDKLWEKADNAENAQKSN